MKKLNNSEKREIKAGISAMSIATGLIAFTSIGELVLNLLHKYWPSSQKDTPTIAPVLPYSPDSPAAHEAWLKLQELEQKRLNSFLENN
ncbi:hypothetical protein [Mycoplasma ovis]|nr:hypothetical protein [Mycoplasma ovis]